MTKPTALKRAMSAGVLSVLIRFTVDTRRFRHSAVVYVSNNGRIRLRSINYGLGFSNPPLEHSRGAPEIHHY